MKKTAYIIPGFTESPRQKVYQEIARTFQAKGVSPIPVPVKWRRKVMSDYTREFLKKYPSKKFARVYILGFSFGAVMAFLTTPTIRPKALILCSLSPYFAADIPLLKKSWKRLVGQKRLTDFKQYDFNKTARQINCRTILLVGEKENQRVKDRVALANKRIKNSKLIVVPGSSHDIRNQKYLLAVKKVIRSL